LQLCGLLEKLALRDQLFIIPNPAASGLGFHQILMMHDALIECVPNFSEGRDMAVIKQITDEIQAVEGVSLLDVDPGAATNRTVVTFVGAPGPVMEAAFRAVRKASQLIDMSRHKGEHPRFGATDVLPLIPIAGITMEETATLARQLAKRIGEELNIGIYCYEQAALSDKRRNLAAVRDGEYEGLPAKLAKPEWKPDFGPATFNPKTGVIAVGARDFLIACNVNLNTTSTRRANAIAYDVREKGRPKRIGDPVVGKIATDANGEQVFIPGTLKCVKAIGWLIEEYGIAQVSINLTNISVTPLHVAFEEVCRKADARGVRATGLEIVGLVPLRAILEAGRFYLKKQQRSTGVSEGELIKIAIKSMGLSDLKPFIPEEKIIEYRIAPKNQKKLVNLTGRKFVEETASESPAPGGGSVAAYVGALGAALGTMVANLSAHKPGWDARWEEFSNWAEKGKAHHDTLLRLVDEDTEAFNLVMKALGMPKGNDAEKAARNQALAAANQTATEVPLRVMKAALESMEVIKAMAETGNPNSISDAGVGALCARTAVAGAWLNVRINVPGNKDKEFVARVLSEGAAIEKSARALESEILAKVEAVLAAQKA
jgi:glutamate formiminotransferase/formiminotetrahydrofolate cyclodeaminase